MENKDTQTQNPAPTTTAEPLVHDISMNESKPKDMPMKKVAIIFICVIIAGIATGLGASYVGGRGPNTAGKTNASGTKTMSGSSDVIESAGIADKEAFSDKAEGTLKEKTEKDFLEEGSYKLIRPGGESQTVHLTSSTVDMSEFVNKKVRVYGETFASEKVGWLMDVGFIEVIK
jgi:hypothetical protein